MRDKTKYNAYIASSEWQEKRKQVFEQKWYKCEACGITEWLHVHHWTYRRLYKEKLSDLFVLCGYCHMSLHDKYWTKDLLRATKAFIEWRELIPRKKKSKARWKSKKVRAMANVALYWLFRLQKHVTLTKVQMLASTRFNEKKYKRFIEKWWIRKNKMEITITHE